MGWRTRRTTYRKVHPGDVALLLVDRKALPAGSDLHRRRQVVEWELCDARSVRQFGKVDRLALFSSEGSDAPGPRRSVPIQVSFMPALRVVFSTRPFSYASRKSAVVL